MRVRVDAANQRIYSEDSVWPFHLNVRQGSATILLGGVTYFVRAQTWQEKTRLARFVRLGESFLRSSLLDCCTSGAENLSAEFGHILLALANWLNRPDEDTVGLPLDANQLAKVTMEVCRSMGIPPAAINDLAAPEVELLWRNLNRESGWERPNSMPPAEQEYDTKIVVLPDAARAETIVSPVAPSRSAPAEPASHGMLSAPARHIEPEAPRRVRAESKPERAGSTLESNQTAAPHLRASTSVEPGLPQGRFRVSFNTVQIDERRAFPVARDPAIRKSQYTASASSAAINEPRPSATSAGFPSVRSLTERAPDSVECPEPAMADWRNSQPAMYSPTSAVPTAPTVLDAEITDAFPAFASEQQVAPMDALLDEFCQRLDEAAADLGILEEV